jgi:serine/threonine-protein kinase
MNETAGRLATALAGRYRIERELGQGGMATVYLAHDLKHDRDVAIKVLHPDLGAALGGERFLSEIRTTARLQHPHILPLLDSGDAGGLLYYVMPVVSGETLRARLERENQLPIDDALRIAREVADALEHAHGLGVIHRDIKPENILLQGGHALVADFGIALAVQQAGGQRLTQTGLSLGTPQYMSPEQAMGERTIDARSDIYALGAVTYEMLTGDPPFTGSTVQAIVAKVLTEKPAPLLARRERVTLAVEHAVLTALEKLPADRFASAAEFSRALGDSSFPSSAATAASVAPATGWRQRAAVPALVAAAALAAALVWTSLRPNPPPPIARYRLKLADGQALSSSTWARLAVSPDGSTLVYVADGDQGTRLVMRTRDQLDAIALPGTEGAINPSISPDGKRVAFMDRVSAGRIKVVSLAGGPSVSITDSVVGAPGVAWRSDGFIYYDRLGLGPLMRVPDGGGRAQSIGQLDSTKGELQHSWPDALPNGRGVIMTVTRGGPGGMGSATDEIAVLDVSTGTHRALVRGIVARYARSGHLVYVTADGALMAVPFDQNKMVLTGEPVSLGDGVSVRVGGGAVDLALSATGTLWYAAGKVASSGTFEPVWVGRDGAATRLATDMFGLVGDPTLSRDGTHLAMSIRELTSQIWVKDLTQGTLSRLSLNGRDNTHPAWTPDGRSVMFVSDQRGVGDLYQRLADGSRPETLFFHETRPVSEVTLSPNGAWMIYTSGLGTTGAGDLYARRVGSDSSIALAATAANETSPALSPDGRWLAYVSNESGTHEVYVRPFPNTADGRWQISTQGGQEPVWAHSGKELFYRVAGATNAQMVMDVTTGSTFVPGARRVLFPLIRYTLSLTHQQYTVSPDDRRFIMIRASESDRADQLIVIEGFFEVLKARAPRR